MAYGNNGAPQGQRPAYAKPAGKFGSQAVAGPVTGQKEWIPDPNELGIGYEKELKAGGTYLTFTITKDVKAGTKVSIFANDKVKNRTEKTPTHKMKLSVKKAQA